MSATATRLKARLIPIVVLALLAAGCTGETARQASPDSSATPAASSSGPPPLTDAEVLWIHAVGQLLPTMNKVFTNSPSEMTPATFTALANGAGGCRRELARIGPAGARLQPVQALVEKACQEYDKGAACFAAAASVGIPSSTAEVSTIDKQTRCGFAVSQTGGNWLAEAQMKAVDIENGLGER